MVDTDCVREVAQKIMPEIAAAGNCVIVGRGSAYYLCSRPDAFHVFIYAPFHERVRRLQVNRQKREGSGGTGGDGGPRPRGLHQAIFQRRLARAALFPLDG